MRRNKKKYFKTGTRQKYVKFYTRDSLKNQTSAIISPLVFLLLPMMVLFAWWIMTFRPLETLATFTLPSITLPVISIPEFSIPVLELPSIQVPTIIIPEISVPEITYPTLPTITLEIPKLQLPTIPEITLPTLPIADTIEVLTSFITYGVGAIAGFSQFIWDSIVTTFAQILSFIYGVFVTITGLLWQAIVSLGLIISDVLISIGNGIKSVLTFLDPRPVFSWIGGHITTTKNVISYQLYLLSPYITFMTDSFKESADSLIRNTKDLYNISVYLSQQNS